MWSRVIGESVPAIRAAVPPGSRVLEVGFGDGALSCWAAAEFGWTMLGLDITAGADRRANDLARRFGLSDRLEFRVCRPEETRQHQGQYDAVFIKTVMYSSANLTEYAAWLDWLLSVLKPGGVLVNYETGRASAAVQAYRRLRGREYTDLSLYTGEIEKLYDARFAVEFRRYYGGVSQFLSPVPGVYEAAAAIESMISRRTADNCFAISMVARKPR